MKLYLLRHGEALPAYEDSCRPLSERGRKQATEAGRRLAGVLPRSLEVLHSPKLRAQETAQIVCQEARLDVSPRTASGLLPGDSIEPWFDRALERENDLMLVGHNPFMGDLASKLAGRPIGFATATLVCFRRLEEGSWELVTKP